LQLRITNRDRETGAMNARGNHLNRYKELVEKGSQAEAVSSAIVIISISKTGLMVLDQERGKPFEICMKI